MSFNNVCSWLYGSVMSTILDELSVCRFLSVIPHHIICRVPYSRFVSVISCQIRRDPYWQTWNVNTSSSLFIIIVYWVVSFQTCNRNMSSIMWSNILFILVSFFSYVSTSSFESPYVLLYVRFLIIETCERVVLQIRFGYSLRILLVLLVQTVLLCRIEKTLFQTIKTIIWIVISEVDIKQINYNVIKYWFGSILFLEVQ